MNLIFYFQRDFHKDVVGRVNNRIPRICSSIYYLKYLPYIHRYRTWGSDYCRYTSGYYRHDNDDDDEDDRVEQHPE